MNPKIQKIAAEIEKTKAKISDSQAHLRDLEKQKTELENADLVAAMRGMKATPEEFEAFLAARRGAPEQASTQRLEKEGIRNES